MKMIVDLIISNNLNDDFNKYYEILIPESRLCVYHKDPFYMHDNIIYCEKIGFDYMGSILVLNREPYEYINIFKKLGKGTKIPKEERMKSALTKEEWRTYFNNLWEIENDEEIYYRLIRMYSLIGNKIIAPIDISKWNRENFKKY